MRKSYRLVLAVPLLVLALGYFFLGVPDNGFFPITYQPPSVEVEQLAIATTMTPEAQQLFYKQKPQIASKQTFHSLCNKVQRNTEKTVLLGCFTSDGYRGSIVIQSVTDSRLDGTMEVVAAHELLHAAYQKLSTRERKALAPKLDKAANRVDDSFLSPIIEAYQSGNRKIYYNELHSYLGTELKDLGDPTLEEYYQKYFVDRQAVIAYSTQSRRELVNLQNQSEQLASEIDALESRLQSEETSLQRLAVSIDQSGYALDQKRSELLNLKRNAERALRRGDNSVVQEFENAQARFNQDVRSYNASVESHRDRVSRFNQDFETYKQKINSFNQLNQNQRDIIDTLKIEPVEISDPVISP